VEGSVVGQAKPFGVDGLVSDRDGEDDEAREISERLPLHDPDYGYRVLLRAAFMYRKRRWNAGLVISPVHEEPEFNLGDDDGR